MVIKYSHRKRDNYIYNHVYNFFCKIYIRENTNKLYQILIQYSDMYIYIFFLTKYFNTICFICFLTYLLYIFFMFNFIYLIKKDLYNYIYYQKNVRLFAYIIL
jgi:hypothetical protein